MQFSRSLKKPIFESRKYFCILGSKRTICEASVRRLFVVSKEVNVGFWPRISNGKIVRDNRVGFWL